MGKSLPWQVKIEALKSFKAQEGHTLVGQSYVTSDGFRLGRWVANIRQRAPFLKESQIKDLNEMGFCWNKFKVLPWEDKRQLLLDYKNDHGDLLIPKGRHLDFMHVEEFCRRTISLTSSVPLYFCFAPSDYIDAKTKFRLGAWVDRTRQNKSTMNENLVQELDNLGFVWNCYEAHWESMFELLQDFARKHKHASPKNTIEWKGKLLGQWVSLQRQLYSRKMRNCTTNSAISEERIQRLESIGFRWTVRKVSHSEDDSAGNKCPKRKLIAVSKVLSLEHQAGNISDDSSSLPALDEESSPIVQKRARVI